MSRARWSVGFLTLWALLACDFNRDSRVCVARLEAGEACPLEQSFELAVCTSGHVCSEQTGRCAPAPGSGERCQVVQGCAEGLVCEPDSFGSFSGLCRVAPLRGELCQTICEPGLACVGGDGSRSSGRCAETSTFSDCFLQGDCPRDHFCDVNSTNTCVPKVGAGEACARSIECGSDTACLEGGRCGTPPAEGAPCRDVCAEGSFCDPGPDGSSRDPDLTSPAFDEPIGRGAL